MRVSATTFILFSKFIVLFLLQPYFENSNQWFKLYLIRQMKAKVQLKLVHYIVLKIGEPFLRPRSKSIS